MHTMTPGPDQGRSTIPEGGRWNLVPLGTLGPGDITAVVTLGPQGPTLDTGVHPAPDWDPHHPDATPATVVGTPVHVTGALVEVAYTTPGASAPRTRTLGTGVRVWKHTRH